jgi:hypothetical protein
VLTRSEDRRNRLDFEVNSAGGTLAVRLGCCRAVAACAVQQGGGAGVQGALGHAHRGDVLLYGGARAACPRRRRGLRAQMGPARACSGGAGWVEPQARPNPVDRFFLKLPLMQKQFLEKSRNCIKARKILRKSQKF